METWLLEEALGLTSDERLCFGLLKTLCLITVDLEWLRWHVFVPGSEVDTAEMKSLRCLREETRCRFLIL